ncbi:Phage shock protein PspC (stress-responsive transcriptional regulator) [Propionibacterium cyclohexanicum]|uniref:Phage shock protein PspC (Stress-responsive transcriptional regulator) n=1 Tax=Propionibacterium cyclohexanicum TaxID=64702 RepID=A0A1H9QIB3_9ACTN|nr:PspC domain-containing protein [Propionibacterium cyclohexanicum]SER60202.1 Phage shock protein PspC (stress-responsive transcriptional regulator) [Propionibacterium cyclohexanicum]
MSERKLVRSRDHRMIAGVAGGIGEYLNIDANIVRLAFVLVAVFTFGTALLLYVAGWLLLPDEKDGVRGFDEVRERIQDFQHGRSRRDDPNQDTFDPYAEK